MGLLYDGGPAQAPASSVLTADSHPLSRGEGCRSWGWAGASLPEGKTRSGAHRTALRLTRSRALLTAGIFKMTTVMTPSASR